MVNNTTDHPLALPKCSAALACSFIRTPPWDWDFDNPQPSRRTG
jgi:hypothetical protein